MSDVLEREPLAWTGVADRRPVFSKELGEFFRTLRENRGLGLRQAADLAERHKLKAVTLNRLGGLERGETKNPAPDLLRALSTLYGVSYDVLVAKVVEHRHGLTRPTSEPTGQDVGRSELHSSAQSRVNSQGTQRAKRPASLQGAEYVEPCVSDFAPAAAEIAVRLIDIIADLSDLFHALMPTPNHDEAPARGRRQAGRAPGVRVSAGSVAATARKRRKAS